VRFLIDAQRPIALAKFIRGRGHDATHVADLGMAAADDPPIWDRAVREGEVIVTKDEDFALRRLLTTVGPQVV
jgi:predicted nuclease of predicted toxin-antitoxin system